VVESLDSDIRPWSLLEELAGLGDSNGDPWLVWVGADRQVFYGPAELDFQYSIQQGGLYRGFDTRAAVDPWSLWPGLCRDLAYTNTILETGSMFADGRDLWIAEVEVTADGSVSLKTELFDEGAILMAQVEAQKEQVET
jgi:hypothetical protein